MEAPGSSSSINWAEKELFLLRIIFYLHFDHCRDGVVAWEVCRCSMIAAAAYAAAVLPSKIQHTAQGCNFSANDYWVAAVAILVNS